jgi:glycosyltransferase involved in cell wall biosynthesis
MGTLANPAEPRREAAPGRHPEVAVVVPCHNAEPWLRAALDSILSQRDAATETIVVNDGSTDATPGILEEFSGAIRRIDTDRRGPSAARNCGLNAATATKVLFLDADDYMEGPYLAASLDASRRADAQLTFGGYCVETSAGERSPPVSLKPQADPILVLKEILGGNFPQTACVLWDVRFLRSIGGWREDIRLGEDIELLIRALTHLPTVAHSAVGHVIYHNHSTSTRLTRNRTANRCEAQYLFYEDLLPHLARLGDPEVVRLLGLQHYVLARTCYAAGFEELGRRFLDRARALGFLGHIGSTGEILVAKLVGLKRQVRYLGRARRVKHWLARMDDPIRRPG